MITTIMIINMLNRPIFSLLAASPRQLRATTEMGSEKHGKCSLSGMKAASY
jgi:hypothetical protein